jgi:hypothetical protein
VSFGTLVELKAIGSAKSVVTFRKKWYGRTDAYLSMQTMFAVEGPHVFATGDETPDGNDWARVVAAKARSAVGFLDMIEDMASMCRRVLEESKKFNERTYPR